MWRGIEIGFIVASFMIYGSLLLSLAFMYEPLFYVFFYGYPVVFVLAVVLAVRRGVFGKKELK